jgi:hypothetical protein
MRYIADNPRRVWVAIAAYVALGLAWPAVVLLPLRSDWALVTLFAPMPLLIIYSVWHARQPHIQIAQLCTLALVPALAAYVLMLAITIMEEDPLLTKIEAAAGGLVAAGVAAVLLVICCAFFRLAVVLLLDRLRAFHGPGMCQKCGYNLTGNISGRCPECGTTIPELT